MIVDLGEKVVDELPDYDLCIVGTGPAGTTLAAELADAGLRICVLESGRLRTTAHADALRRVISEGIRIKDYSRERVLGGASSTWAGLSAPLDPIDMGPRPWLRHAGWPIAREALLPYWEAAAERYRFAPPVMFGADGFGALKERGDLVLRWRDVEEKTFLACSDPQDFGREFRHVFESAAVDLYLDATALRLESAMEGVGGAAAASGVTEHAGAPSRGVTHAVVRNSGGSTLALRARVFVLATGGLENARLLLASQDLCAAGLGNERDQVGRCLMNHPKNYHGVVRLARPIAELPYHFGCLTQGYAGYAGLRLRESVQRERGLLNAYVRFEPLYPWSDNKGVEALVFLVKHSGGLFGAWKRRQRGKLVTLRDYSETGDDSDLQNERKSALDIVKLCGLLLANAPMVARYAVSRTFSGRAPPVRAIRLRNFMEMEPDPENRVLLSEERDSNGERVPIVRHQSTPLDRRSLIALHRELVREFADNGLGELQTALDQQEVWPIDQDASHHLGTTRMGTDAATSVVTPDLRLHAVDNVFCAGGSVFPTSGCANPTFTIVALSIRLAEHLRTHVFGAPATASAAAPRAAFDLAAVAPRYDGPRPCLRVAIIGAGKRVRTDVLPALTALPGRFEIVGLFARGRHALVSAGRTWHSEGLDALSAERLAACDLVYMAVSKDAVPGVLAHLGACDLARTDLLIDTPVLLFKHLAHRRRLAAFRRVWVAEDCTLLPWFDTLAAARARGLIGAPTEIVFDRSAWRYHALAMFKTLFDCRDIRSARRRRTRDGTGGATTRADLTFANGAHGVLLGPRRYATGHFRISDGRTVVTDARSVPAAAALQLQPTLSDGACTGFRIGDAATGLAPVERALLGPVHADQSVTALMEPCKRVGLARMLRTIHEGGDGYPLDEGLDDMLVDYFLEKLGRATPRALFSLKSGSGRALLTGVARMLGGR